MSSWPYALALVLIAVAAIAARRTRPVASSDTHKEQ